jgi:hypothetical protein
MNKEEIKKEIDIKDLTIEEREIQEEIKEDFIINNEGNPIILLKPLETKLIEKIQELESRIAALESDNQNTTK